MSIKEQIEKVNTDSVPSAENNGSSDKTGLTSTLQSAEKGEAEIIEKTEQNKETPKEKSWGEKYNDAIDAQMKERSEVLNNRPLSEKELNEMLTRQREIIEKIISER